MRMISYALLCGALALTAPICGRKIRTLKAVRIQPSLPACRGARFTPAKTKNLTRPRCRWAPDKDGNAKEKTDEGEIHTWDYGTREGVSEIQVFRNFETA